MNFAKLLIWFVLLSCTIIVESRVYSQHRRAIDADDVLFAENSAVAVRDLTAHDFHKRGIGGLIANVIMSTATLASTGVQLWTALSEGCNFYPSICTDKEEIKRLEGVLSQLSKTYDDLFYANQWRYLNLKVSMVNNQYILHYINDTVRAVEDIGDMIDRITTRLEVDLKTMDKMYSSGNGTATIETLVGPFEFQLAKFQKMIEDQKKSQIIGIVVQRVAEMFIQKSIKYVGKVISRAKGDNLDVGDNVVNRLSSSNADLPPAKQSFWKKTKNFFNTKAKSVGFAFKAVGADIKRKFGTSLPKNLEKWVKAGKSWTSFKTQFKKSFFKPTSTIGKIRNFFKSPKSSIKYSLKNFKFKPGQAFLQGVGLVVDGIQTYLDVKNWKKISEELSTARQKYEGYHTNVLAAIEEVKNETTKLGRYWADTIGSFQDLVANFENTTTSARENKVYNDVFGLAGTPVDTSDVFFHTNFAVVNEKELKGKQQIVVNFFNANGKKLSTLRDKFKVQETLITQTKDLVSKDQEIYAIFETLRTIYGNFDSAVLKSYSSKLVERDVVCAAAFCLPNKNEYDYYPIDDFRNTKCLVSNDSFTKIQQDAMVKRKRKILGETITKYVPLKKNPALILSLAKEGYAASKQAPIQTFGSNLKEQDIVCSIATTFTDMDNYMFYDLTAFRPDCSRVSASKFKEFQDIAKKTENARDTIKFSMQFCVQFNQCNCPAKLAESAKISVQQINLLIEKYKQNNKPTCNYVETNGKCKWQC